MDIFTDFLETSTIHGLAYISNVPSKTGKALWLTIVIAGFCTAGYLISDSFKEWDETPIDTSISTHPIATLPLPFVTICPPDHSNTALNLDLVRAGGINLTNALCVKPCWNLEIKKLWLWLPFSQARIISDENIWTFSPFQFLFQFIFGYELKTVCCSSKIAKESVAIQTG